MVILLMSLWLVLSCFRAPCHGVALCVIYPGLGMQPYDLAGFPGATAVGQQNVGGGTLLGAIDFYVFLTKVIDTVILQ